MLERTRFDQGTTLHPDPNGNNLIMQQTNQMINNNTTSTATMKHGYAQKQLIRLYLYNAQVSNIGATKTLNYCNENWAKNNNWNEKHMYCSEAWKVTSSHRGKPKEQ